MKTETVKKTGKRKWIMILAAVLTLAAFGLSCPAAEGNMSSAYMEVSSVYGDVGRLGSHIPLNVKIYNQSDGPLNGFVCITTLESKRERESEVYEYEYPVEVSPGETKTVRLNVPLGQRSSEIYVTLRDGDGNQLQQDKMEFDVSKETGSLLIGVLDDNIDEIRYLDGVSLDYGMVRSKLLELDTSSFPSDATGLELLDILIINDFKTDRLSDKQQDAVWQWVQEGGILLFGTGMRVSDTLGPFTKDLVEVPYDPPVMETVSMGVEYAEQTPGDMMVELVCANLSVPGGDELIASDELPLLTMVARGSGRVGIFSFDMGDLNGFVTENPSYSVNVLTSILGEDRINNLYFYSVYGHEQEYWNARSLVDTGSAERLPNVKLYGIVILFYVVIAGPGLYLILKKKDQRRYYGFVLTLFALVSSAVVYLIGVRTRFQTEFFTYASVRDVSENRIEETVFLNIRTPDSRPYSVVVAPGYQVSPITKNSSYNDVPMETLEANENGNLTVRAAENGTSISAKKSLAFDPRFFKLTKKSENASMQGISAELKFFEGEIYGTITNHYSFALEKTALILYGHAVPIGRLEPGETRTVDSSDLLIYPAEMTYILANRLSGGEAYKEADISDQEYLRTVEQTNLYSYYINLYYGQYTSEARVIAFGLESSAEEIFAEPAQSLDGLTLYTSVVDIDMEQDGKIYRSGLMRRPKMSTGSGTFYSGYTTIYGTDPIMLEYYLGSDIQVEKLWFLPVSDEFMEDPQYYYLQNFKGAVYFYNYNTKAYDQVDIGKQEFSGEELSEYLSPSNSLTVKYVSAESGAGNSSSLPLLMVTGRER